MGADVFIVRVILPLSLRNESHLIGYVKRRAVACRQHLAESVGLSDINLKRCNALVAQVEKVISAFPAAHKSR